MDTDAALKNRVKELRARLGLRQVDLAEAVGITRQTVIAIEKGRLNPSIAIALRLARVLREPVDYVFYLEAGALSPAKEETPPAADAASQPAPGSMSREEEAVRQAAALIDEFSSKAATQSVAKTEPSKERESVEMPAFASLPEAEPPSDAGGDAGAGPSTEQADDDGEETGGAIWDFT